MYNDFLARVENHQRELSFSINKKDDRRTENLSEREKTCESREKMKQLVMGLDEEPLLKLFKSQRFKALKYAYNSIPN